MKKLEKFIKDNNLLFNGHGSALNSDCTIISGYAISLGIQDSELIERAINEVLPEAEDFESELNRVFDYACSNNYGTWWVTEEAKLTYKF